MGTDQPIQHVNFRDVADEILKTVPLFVMADDNTFYIYKDGVYMLDDAELNRKIRDLSDQMNIERGISKPRPVTRQFIAEALDYIRVHRMFPRDAIGSNSNILNLENGLLNVDTMEFTEHTDRHYSIVQYPVKYDLNAKCPAIEKFLNEVVLHGDLETLIEYTGYSLVPGNSMKVLMMLYGGRDAGKSTYCKLIESLVGARSVAHVSPQSIQDDKFAKARLYGKILNTVPDIGDKPLSGTESIKSLIGNDEISADQKYKNSINFVNRSHIFWGANSVPDIKNDDLDFYDKVLMANFPHKFVGSKRNLSLVRQLITPSELSGFLNVLLAARKRLIERGGFIESATGFDSRSRYRRQSNPIACFLEEHVVSSMDNIQKPVLHDHYVKWCNANGIRGVAPNIFGKKLRALGYEDTQLRIESGRPSFWLGIAYVAHKPIVQMVLNVRGGGGCQDFGPLSSDMDTGEWESEKEKVSEVTRVISHKLGDKENIEYSIEAFGQKPLQPLTPSTDGNFQEETIRSSSDDPLTSSCAGLLRYDLVNFVKAYYPGFVVDSVPSLVEAFCRKWPGYKNNPGSVYICQFAEKMAERGWK